MAKVVIGGVETDIPALNIKAIKKVWPVVQEAQKATDPLEAVSHAIHVIAIGLLAKEDKTLGGDDYDTAIAAKCAEIEEGMLGTEVPKLREAMREVLTESGLLNANAASGEALGDAPMVPGSTETSIG